MEQHQSLPAATPADATTVKRRAIRTTRTTLLAELRDGLHRPARELPPRFLADPDATPLRRRLQRLADERLAPVETPLVESAMASLLDSWSPRAVVHLAPAKSRASAATIDAAVRSGSVEAYVAVDLAAPPVDEAVERMRASHPSVSATRIVADVTTELPLSRTLPRPRVLIALGNALGSFGTLHAVRALRLVQASMHGGDRLLLGVDLRRDPALFEAEYARDAEGRAAYHRHALRLLERDLGAELDASAFTYRPRYDVERRRVEHRLVATSSTSLAIPGLPPITLRTGDGILTAVSCTFERASLFSLLAGVGLSLDTWLVDARGEYAVATASPLR
jgi:L-histidine N-alpha-methyltransferase